MNDYREVGDLSVRAMLSPKEEGTLSPPLQRGVRFLPIPLPPRAWASLAGRCPLVTRCSARGTRWGLPCSTVNDTSREGTVYGPGAVRPCIPTLKWDIRLCTLLVQALSHLKPVQIYGPCDNSDHVARLPNLAPESADASRFKLDSRDWSFLCKEDTLSQVLGTQPLPAMPHLIGYA